MPVMLRQLGHREAVRMHSRIVDVDLKNNACVRRARFDLGRELLCTAQHDPAVDRLPTGSIAPPEFPHSLSIPAVGFLSGFRSALLLFCSGIRTL